jgi:hypothetical protein
VRKEPEEAKVLVTVKAYPQLSQKSGEVVCVAGVRLDREPPEWIRLFPVPFRDLPEAIRFKKFDVVSLRIRRGDDTRPESYRPDLDHIEIVRSVGAGRDQRWTQRRKLIGALLGETTMCRLYRENERRGSTPAPSLGLIKPVEVLDVTVQPNEGFDDDRKRLAAIAAEATLFGPCKEELEPTPYLVRYRYRCVEDGCRGHDQSLIDWEVGEAGRKWSRSYPVEEIPYRIRRKFLDQLCGPERDTHFFVGNAKRYLQSFMVLGVFWPKITPEADPALF